MFGDEEKLDEIKFKTLSLYLSSRIVRDWRMILNYIRRDAKFLVDPILSQT